MHILSSCSTKRIIPEERVPVQYFYKTEYFLKNKPGPNSYTKIKKKKHDFIKIENIFNFIDDSVMKKANKSWAIRIEDQNYFNLRFASYPLGDVFTKFDIEGMINVLIIDHQTSGEVKSVLFN